jgi:chaperonin GroES
MSKEPSVIDRRPTYDDTPAEPALFTAQPIGDYIVVKRIPEPEGLIIEADVAKDKPINCRVVAISQHPSSELARAALQALKIGDTVLIRRYSGTEVKVNRDEYTLVIIFDVLLKL